MIIPDPFNSKPDFINKHGVKWWKDKVLQHKAKEVGGTTWLTELPGGYKSRLLIINNEIDYETTNLEAMAVRIDMIKLAEDMYG